MKPKVLLYNKIPAHQLEKLLEVCNVRQYTLEETKGATFLEDIVDATGIIGSNLIVDETLLNHAPKLKIVSNISVGYNNLNTEALTKRGIMATNTPDVLTDTTADTVFGLLLAAARRIPELDHYVKSGNWNGSITPEHFGVDVHHKTLGIIGMGRIGTAVAERGHFGFKMNILYYNRSRNTAAEGMLGATYTSFESLLENADYVCLMAPLVPETVNLMDRKAFQRMKPTAIFINGSRGPLVVEKDLIAALQQKEIRAAGLDVYREEPIYKQNPLLKMSNVVTLPHIGSATAETRDKMAALAVDNLLAGIQGKTPPSLINKSYSDKR